MNDGEAFTPLANQAAADSNLTRTPIFESARKP
jgi:hypothetical protein